MRAARGRAGSAAGGPRRSDVPELRPHLVSVSVRARARVRVRVRAGVRARVRVRVLTTA